MTPKDCFDGANTSGVSAGKPKLAMTAGKDGGSAAAGMIPLRGSSGVSTQMSTSTPKDSRAGKGGGGGGRKQYR